jgi:hypothetical protein
MWHEYWYVPGYQYIGREVRPGIRRSTVNMQRTAIAPHDGGYPRDKITRQAIFELLQARDMRPGDSINIILAQFEIERKGIDTTEFSAGMVQFLGNGLLDIQGNAFYLTTAGFDALRRGIAGANS